MRPKHFFYPAVLLASLLCGRLAAAWADGTAGLPWLEHQSSRSLGTEGIHLCVAEDRLGRLYVGSVGLLVNDGASWRTFRAANAGGIRAIEFGPDGRLWVAALNEMGYFTEPSTGTFQYRSLLEHLPENERQVGHIWGVSVAGSQVYFMGRDKLYRWDGAAFRTWSYPGSSRLFPLKLDGEGWFQHWETGLYRLTETGPKLEVDGTRLPNTGILGLRRDAGGLLVVSSLGFFRPGDPPRKIFADTVNRFIEENRLTTFALLPDGNYLVATLNGGLLLVSPEGAMLRVIDTRDHAAISVVQSFWVRADGQVWCAAQDGIVRVEANGTVTAFHARNGLDGGASDIDLAPGGLHLTNPTGVYRLSPGAGGRGASFVRLEGPKEAYNTLAHHGSGFLLGRHGGLDYFDGTGVTPVYKIVAKGVYAILPTEFPGGNFVLSEGDALVQLRPQPDGSFRHSTFGRLPDFINSLAEDTRGRIWAGTASQGALTSDPVTATNEAVVDPETQRPIRGAAVLSRSDSDLFIFAEQRVRRTDPDGGNLRNELPLPGILPTVAQTVPSAGGTVLAFKRAGASSATSWGQGLGLLARERGTLRWQEFDLPALESVGLVRSLKFTEESGRAILWVGGTEGLLRVDYDQLPRMAAPPAPLIRLDAAQSGKPVRPQSLDFPFDGHRLSFRVFTGDAVRVKDWLLQVRFGQDAAAWLPVSNRRSYEYSNLSEGEYRFEVRAVNAAGLASETAVFAFRILPPWYRSNGAYASYVLALVLVGWGTTRIRERRILAQKAELETLVQQRTAELVKANAAKDDFLAGVSHEIRNPMNGVIGIAESLRTAGLDPESRRKFGLLRQCAGHLSSLLEDILDISKMQAGVVELETKPFDLHELVGTVAAMAASDSEKYHIPVETAISPGVPRHLLGDARRVRQLLLNFVSNALKFSGRGKVDLTVWCQPARQAGQTEVIFAVSDDGPGISAEEQSKLFTRFERGAAAQQGRVPGTGLGLALCRGFAERMGGRVWLESEPGRGSCFYFSAPFALAVPPDEPAAAPGPITGIVRKHALVVDDQEYNRIVLTDLLTTLGYSVESAGTGREALSLAERGDFDLMFLDYDLPGLNGLEVARRVRGLRNRSARAHILATTAFSTPEKRQDCLGAGMNAFLGKPVTLERLRRALGEAEDALPPTPAEAPSPEPANGLANLRLLATKKQVPFEEEVALYLSELQVELDQLDDALAREQTAEAAHHAHRLCGRFSFIYERELEHLLRGIEEDAAHGHWPAARRRRAEVEHAVSAMRLRLASSSPVAPPE